MLFSPHHFAAPVSLCCLTKLAVFSLSLHSEKDQTPYELQARDLNVAFHTANTLCVLVIPFTSVSPSSSCDVARLNYFPLCAIAVQPVWPRLLVCSFFSFPILFLSLSLPSTYISQPLLLRLYFCFTSHDIPPPHPWPSSHHCFPFYYLPPWQPPVLHPSITQFEVGAIWKYEGLRYKCELRWQCL